MSVSKQKSFTQLARNKQGRLYINVKNRIRRAAPQLGGTFITHDYLNGKNGWADIYFLSCSKALFYNVTLQTTRYAYREAVEMLAYDRSYEVVEEREAGFWTSGYTDPATGDYVIPPWEPPGYPEFDGQSRMDWIGTQYEPIANAGVVEVYEQWTLHDDYAYGIGLHATLDVPYLTIEAIQDFIERFLQTEKPWRNPDPIRYAYDEIDHWGLLESNAVIYPWDWPEDEGESLGGGTDG